jgi:hypothetical protein
MESALPIVHVRLTSGLKFTVLLTASCHSTKTSNLDEKADNIFPQRQNWR